MAGLAADARQDHRVILESAFAMTGFGSEHITEFDHVRPMGLQILLGVQ